MDTTIFKNCTGFDWDKANQNKNWDKHQVSIYECEQVFLNETLLVVEDHKHSAHEKRFCALGVTNRSRKLFLGFTIRDDLIRVISARDMSVKERVIYEQV
jgi:uncharacterized DUF497 family protein